MYPLPPSPRSIPSTYNGRASALREPQPFSLKFTITEHSTKSVEPENPAYERERSLQGGENWTNSEPTVKIKRKFKAQNQREKELKRDRRTREPKHMNHMIREVDKTRSESCTRGHNAHVHNQHLMENQNERTADEQQNA